MIAFIDWQKLLDLPVLASDHGRTVDNFIIYIHWLMGILFLGWFAYFVYTIYKFHASKNPRANYHGVQNHASSYIEIAVIVAEVVLLLGIAVPAWAKVVDDFPSTGESTEVQVIGQQFSWTFRYPGPDGVFGSQSPDLVTVANRFGVDPNDSRGADDFDNPSEMIVPVNRPVIAQITSLDVIHSFSVHPMRITQDATPGLRSPIHFTPTKEGKFMITCAQLCGSSHYAMKGLFTVVSQEAYDEWLAGKSPAPAASAPAAAVEYE